MVKYGIEIVIKHPTDNLAVQYTTILFNTSEERELFLKEKGKEGIFKYEGQDAMIRGTCEVFGSNLSDMVIIEQ